MWQRLQGSAFHLGAKAVGLIRRPWLPQTHTMYLPGIDIAECDWEPVPRSAALRTGGADVGRCDGKQGTQADQSGHSRTGTTAQGTAAGKRMDSEMRSTGGEPDMGISFRISGLRTSARSKRTHSYRTGIKAAELVLIPRKWYRSSS